MIGSQSFTIQIQQKIQVLDLRREKEIGKKKGLWFEVNKLQNLHSFLIYISAKPQQSPPYEDERATPIWGVRLIQRF
jgi:hypothetical protein